MYMYKLPTVKGIPYQYITLQGCLRSCAPALLRCHQSHPKTGVDGSKNQGI